MIPRFFLQRAWAMRSQCGTTPLSRVLGPVESYRVMVVGSAWAMSVGTGSPGTYDGEEQWLDLASGGFQLDPPYSVAVTTGTMSPETPDVGDPPYSVAITPKDPPLMKNPRARGQA